MRWDAKTKKALIDLLRVKLRTALSAKMATRHHAEARRWGENYKLLLKELGMSLVEQVRQPFGRNHWADPETKSPARTKDHILIGDPLRGRIPSFKNLNYGLKIPKETAMKILVLNHLPSGD